MVFPSAHEVRELGHDPVHSYAVSRALDEGDGERKCY
jgi:hypothetical protein